MRNGFHKVPWFNFIKLKYLLSIACIDGQYLAYGYYELEDRYTLESYGIGEGATIHLSREYAESDEAYCIYVQRTEEEGTEEVFPVWIEASDTIGSLKTSLMNSIAFHGP